MSFCQSCGAQIPDGSAFCTECGARVNQTQEPVQAPAQQPQMNVAPAMQSRVRSRQKAATPTQPNPLEEWVISTADKISSFASLKTAMIVVILCQLLDVIYNGEIFHFSGALSDLTEFFVDNCPIWLWKTIYELASIYLFINIIDTCYKIGMRSWLLYVTPLLWAGAVVLFDIIVIADLSIEDLKWSGRMVILAYILVGVIGYQLCSTRFSWLGKVTIITAVLWIIGSLASESLVPTILAMVASIYWAVVAKNEIVCKKAVS